jgi:hypothetical protein
MIDFILQALSAGGLFYGLWQMGNARLRGPAVVAAAELCAFAVGISHGVWSLALIGAVLFFIQGRNFLKWRSEGKPW